MFSIKVAAVNSNGLWNMYYLIYWIAVPDLTLSLVLLDPFAGKYMVVVHTHTHKVYGNK